MCRYTEQQLEGQFYNCGDSKLIKEGKIAAGLDNMRTEF